MAYCCIRRQRKDFDKKLAAVAAGQQQQQFLQPHQQPQGWPGQGPLVGGYHHHHQQQQQQPGMSHGQMGVGGAGLVPGKRDSRPNVVEAEGLDGRRYELGGGMTK